MSLDVATRAIPPANLPALTLGDGEEPRFTGAAIRSNLIVLATVQASEKGIELCRSESARLMLWDRSQGAMREFLDELQGFASDAGIRRVVLRGQNANAQFRGNPLGFKIEAALQLVTDLTTDIIHFNTIDAWVRQWGYRAPRTVDGLAHSEKPIHQHAIAAACFALEQASGMHPDWMRTREWAGA